MARERGLDASTSEGFEKLMEEQRARARAAQKKTVDRAVRSRDARRPRSSSATITIIRGRSVLEVVRAKDKNRRRSRTTRVCYAEMGGQVGDTGEMSA